MYKKNCISGYSSPSPFGRVTVNGLEKCACVRVCDPAVPQELNTPGVPYLACIHSCEVARMSTC